MYRIGSSMLLVLARKKDIGNSSLPFPCLLHGRKNRRCLFPACYREGASVQLEPVVSFFLVCQRAASSMLLVHQCRSHATGFSLYIDTSFLRPLSDNFDWPSKVHPWTVQRFFRFLGRAPVKREEIGETTQAGTAKAATRPSSATGKHKSGRQRQGEQKPGSRRPTKHRQTPEEPAPPTVCNCCPMLGPQVGSLCDPALTGA